VRAGDVVQAVVARLRADAALVAALGGERIYRNGAFREKEIPSVEWFVVAAPPAENTVAVLMQLDVWATSYAQAETIAARLLANLHRELPEPVAGLPMFLQYRDRRDYPDADPGVVRVSLDFVFEPAREVV
jgi:hypothetical protein